jgi:hypothetical protein
MIVDFRGRERTDPRQIELRCNSIAQKVLGDIGNRLVLAANRYIVCQRALDAGGE